MTLLGEEMSCAISTVGLVMAGGEAMASKGLVAVAAGEALRMPGLVTVGQPY